MNIEESNILDIDTFNLDKEKIKLSDSILKNVNPLLNNMQETLTSELKKRNDLLENKKTKVQESKLQIESFLNQYERQKKIRKLLDRIDILIQEGLVNEGHLKQETVAILKVVDKLSDDQLERHLKQTMNVISKRFAK